MRGKKRNKEGKGGRERMREGEKKKLRGTGRKASRNTES